MTFMGQRSHQDYRIGWVCALPIERAAATAALDEIHPGLSQSVNDNNVYTLGKISSHNIVIACLPSGIYGISSATAVIRQMLSTFPHIQFGFMVGIGGGAPSASVDIRLGDIVVSIPSGSSTGVIQYDYGKTLSDGKFTRTGFLNKPPLILLNAVSTLIGNYRMGRGLIADNLKNALAANPQMASFFMPPGAERDVLFESTYEHVENQGTCAGCDADRLVRRQPRPSKEPCIHYGTIASANQVMRHGMARDRLSKEHGILCFEMEAAGLMDQLPCLVVRGICDYSDSHKNKIWQDFAAGVAAVYTKELLGLVPAQVGEKGMMV